jgi:hypothetical protein
MLGGIGEEHLVVSALDKDVDRAQDVPSSGAQSLDDLLTDVVVGEERKPYGHYFWCRLKYSARSRSCSASQRSLSR